MTDSTLNVLATGTSSGFGRRIAETLANRGHHVFASMRGVNGKNAEAAEAMRAFAETNGTDLDAIELDITEQKTIDHAVEHILGTSGRIDVVVNNAASATMGLLEAFTIDEVRESLENVALGALRVDKAVLPAMRRQGSGLLIHVSSTGGRIIAPFVSPYSAGKAALEAFAEEFSFALAPLGIDSIIVEPGGFGTEGLLSGSAFTTPSNARLAEEYGEVGALPAKLGAGFGEAFSGPNAPDPQEVADAVAELIELPGGQRPLRTVVGTLVTAGVRELNAAYDARRRELLTSLGMN